VDIAVGALSNPNRERAHQKNMRKKQPGGAVKDSTQGSWWSKKKNRETVFAYAMMGPDIIGLALFKFAPIIMAFVVSLHSWNALQPMKYLGLDNYATLVSDVEWWQSVARSVQFTVFFVGMVYVGGLGLAVFLQSLKARIQEILRTIYFLPYAVSMVVAGIIWLFMMQEKRGYMNAIVRAIGVDPLTYLSNSSTALFWVAFVFAWINVGYYMILFLAAVKDIPQSLFDAAHIDGASPLQEFRHITLPQIREVSTFVLIVTTVLSFQVFDVVKVMTNGGPANATQVSVFYIYKHAFEFGKLGYSSALAFVLFVLLFGVSLLQLRIMERKR